jgi:hypothetical protein
VPLSPPSSTGAQGEAGFDCIVAAGSAAAPTAGTAFITSAVPPAGVYKLEISYGISGAVEANAQNVRINANAGAYLALPSTMGITLVVPFVVERVTLNGVNTVNITAVANATAATVYYGSLTLTRIE